MELLFALFHALIDANAANTPSGDDGDYSYCYCYCLIFTKVERLALECWKYLCNSVCSMDLFCLISLPFSFSPCRCSVCVCVFFNCLSVVCFYVLSLNWLAKLMAFPLLLKYFGLNISSKGKNLFRVNAPQHKTSLMSVWVKLFHFQGNIDGKL